MKQISNEFSGTFICLDKSNVDTDQIIPKQFLKSIKKTGFGDNLFDGWRYLDEGTIDQETSSRMVNKDFIFNNKLFTCLLYTSPSPRDKRQSRMPSSA